MSGSIGRTRNYLAVRDLPEYQGTLSTAVSRAACTWEGHELGPAFVRANPLNSSRSYCVDCASGS